jgi:hypothetical protein
MQAPLSKIYLRPTQGAEFGSPEPVPIGQQDSASIPGAVAASLARSVDQPFDLGLGQIEIDAVAGIAPWVFHDIRRSVATHMAETGVMPHIVEAVLNHVSGARAGVAGVYNRAVYAEEKKAALAKWADHLSTLIDDNATKSQGALHPGGLVLVSSR